MFCPFCGSENPDINNFCINCGKSLKVDAEPTVGPSEAAPVQGGGESDRTTEAAPTSSLDDQAGSEQSPSPVPGEERPLSGDQPAENDPGAAKSVAAELPPPQQVMVAQPAAPEQATRASSTGERPASADESPAQIPARRRNLLIWIGISVGVLVIAIIATALVLLLTGGGEQILLALPNRDGGAELVLVELGQDEQDGTYLVDNASAAFSTYIFSVTDGWFIEPMSGSSAPFGAFTDGANQLLYWYSDQDETIVENIKVGDDEPKEVMSVRDGSLSGRIMEGGGDVFFNARRDNRERCYVMNYGQDSDRLIGGDFCALTLDGNVAYATELDGNEFSLVTIDVNGKNEMEVLDRVEDVVSARVSDDASHVAYLKDTGRDYQLHLVERKNGDESQIGDEWEQILDYQFLTGSDTLYYIARDIDGELKLFIGDNDDPLVEGVAISARSTPNGKHLVYLIGEDDGNMIAGSLDIRSRENTEIHEGDDVRVSMTGFPTKIIIEERDRDELTIFSADVEGSNKLELFDDDEIRGVDPIYTPHESWIFLVIDKEDGSSLFATPFNRADGFYLLEDWAFFRLLNFHPGGDQLVFMGAEDQRDDITLFAQAVEKGSEPVELDNDNDRFMGASFSRDGKSVIYTAFRGQENDRGGVFQVAVDGRESPERLYKDATLAATSWGGLNPVRNMPYLWLLD